MKDVSCFPSHWHFSRWFLGGEPIRSSGSWLRICAGSNRMGGEDTPPAGARARAHAYRRPERLEGRRSIPSHGSTGSGGRRRKAEGFLPVGSMRRARVWVKTENLTAVRDAAAEGAISIRTLAVEIAST